MRRLTSIFIGICIVLIGAALGVVGFLLMGLKPVEALIVALAAMTALSLYVMVSRQVKARDEVDEHVADLSRGSAEVARQVAELSRRVTAVEAAGKARNAVDPLAKEIGELGTLVKALAETVASHDTKLSQPLLPAAMPVAAPAIVTPQPPAASVAAGEPVAVAMKGKSDEEIVGLIASAVEANRIDLYLQPIVTLPQRKVRYYEALTRLRTEHGTTLMPAEFIPHAEAAGLMPQIDNLMLFRAVQIVRRLLVKNRDVGLFCNLSGSTLSDADAFSRLSQFMDANRALAGSIILECPQAVWRGMGAVETTNLAMLSEKGFRFSVDHVADLRIDPRELVDRGIRFIKVPGELLLNSALAKTADIHAADLSDLLGRYGISLIAERIEAEAMVVDLLDFDVRFGQGLLFSPPRPVRQDALQGAVLRDDGTPGVGIEEAAANRAPEPRTGMAPDIRMTAKDRPENLAQARRA